jgi:hypothetical protein
MLWSIIVDDFLQFRRLLFLLAGVYARFYISCRAYLTPSFLWFHLLCVHMNAHWRVTLTIAMTWICDATTSVTVMLEHLLSRSHTVTLRKRHTPWRTVHYTLYTVILSKWDLLLNCSQYCQWLRRLNECLVKQIKCGFLKCSLTYERCHSQSSAILDA